MKDNHLELIAEMAMKVQKNPVKNVDADAAAKRLAMILFGDQLAESYRKLSNYYSKIMHERMYYGLGAEFVSPLAYEKKQLRELLVYLTMIQKRYAKVAKSGDSESKPYYWDSQLPQPVAEHQVRITDRDLDIIFKSFPKPTAEEKKSFADMFKKEVKEFEEQTKVVERQFDWLNQRDYFALCSDVCEDIDWSSPKAKFTFAPYKLVTKKDIVKLLKHRFKKISEYEKERDGNHRFEGCSKADYNYWISCIKQQIKMFPADMVKEAKPKAKR